jgi:uncharacterized membrane protein
MSLVFLILVTAAIWINLVGAGLAANRLVRDYPIARVAGILAACLAGFSLEHFAGWGPRPPLLPLTTAASVFLIWRHRGVIRANWGSEALFGAGYLYCLAWRYAFPDIDATGERMPNLALIEGYMKGTRLPPPDLWMYPHTANFYYSFQHYGAALLGRLVGTGPGVTYNLAYCTLVGLMTLTVGSCVFRLCAGTVGRWIAGLSLLVGGSGAVVATHLLSDHNLPIDSAQFLGGWISNGPFNAWGAHVSAWMKAPGVIDRDLPMWPMSYVLTCGDYHPPLAGLLLLAFAATLIAAQETGTAGGGRAVRHALLGASLPIALLSNAWVFPLQCVLVVGWFGYRSLRGERRCLAAGLAGAAAACALEYPYLVEFTQQAIVGNAAIRFTDPIDRTPWLGWCLIFWPVVGILALALLNPERRAFNRFLVGVWCAELAATEFLYNNDLYGGPWVRFNSTLKWWTWVYAGIILTLGAGNLGSRSRVCRFGTMVLLVPSLLFGVDLARQFVTFPKASAGRLAGSGWIEGEAVVRDMIVELSSRPDGVALESGLDMANTESPAVSLFAAKQSLLGWPWHETTWRGPNVEIRERKAQIEAFYGGTMADPLAWLLYYNVRYVLWLERDNGSTDARFRPLDDKIGSRYFWKRMYGAPQGYEIGFWERVEGPEGPRPLPRPADEHSVY